MKPLPLLASSAAMRAPAPAPELGPWQYLHRNVSWHIALISLSWVLLAVGVQSRYALITLALAAGTAALSARIRWNAETIGPTAALSVFMLAWLASCLTAADPALQLNLSAVLLPGALAYAIVLLSHPRPADQRLLAGTLAGIAVLTSIWALVGPDRAPLIIVPNDVVLVGVMSPFALMAFGRSTSAVWVFLLIETLALATAAAVHSRTGMVVAVVGGLLALWQLRPRGALLAAFILVAVAAAVDGMQSFATWQKSSAGMMARVELWAAAWSMFLERPWLGWGPFAFGEHYQMFAGESLLDPRATPWPHNLFIETLAGTGLLGLLALFGWLWCIIRGLLACSHSGSWASRGIAIVGSVLVLVAIVEASWLRIWLVLAVFSWAAVASMESDDRELER